MLSGSAFYTGLDGAVGSAFIPTLNRLVFVEFDGEIDAIDLAGKTYHFLGDGYLEPEDIVVAADGDTAYVTERVGNLLRVNLGAAARATAEVIVSGLNAPHQIVLDEAHSRAYVVEFADPGRLLAIDLTGGVVTVVTSHLHWAIGLAITADFSTAYVSQQDGKIRRVDIASGTVTHFVSGLTNPFFLTWLNATQDTLLVPERDPANRISLVSIPGASATVIVDPVAFRPSSVTLTAPGQILIACDQEIDSCNLMSAIDRSVLFLCIGHVPFNAVTGAGRADTTIFPAYFYQVKDAPFGGTLPLIVNHENAAALGAAYYRVLYRLPPDGIPAPDIPGLDVWTDLKLNTITSLFEQQTMTPQVIGGQAGYYPVRTPGDVWANADLGDLMSSLPLVDGLHTLVLEFVDGGGGFVALSNSITLLIDNSPCFAALAEASLDGVTADPTCGFLPYALKNADLVTIDFVASQPHDDATYSFEVIKGVNLVAEIGGPVSTAAPPFTIPLDVLMGDCVVAGCAADLYVAATAINGWDRQSQYDRPAQEAFALAPGP